MRKLLLMRPQIIAPRKRLLAAPPRTPQPLPLIVHALDMALEVGLVERSREGLVALGTV